MASSAPPLSPSTTGKSLAGSSSGSGSAAGAGSPRSARPAAFEAQQQALQGDLLA